MSTINVGSALPSGSNTIGNVKLVDTGGTNQLAIDANNNAHVTLYNATNAMAIDSSNNAHVGVWNGSNQLAVNSGGNAAVNVVQFGGTNVVTGGASGLLAIGGPVASGSSNADNPVKVGGAYNSTQPTVTTGQVVDAQMSARGAQIVATGTDTFNVTINTSLPAGTNIIGKFGIDQTTIGTTNGTTIVNNNTGSTTAAEVMATKRLRVQMDSTQIFYDAWDSGTVDTTYNWNAAATGGNGSSTPSAGQEVLSSGTTASGYAYLTSKNKLQPVSPGYLQFDHQLQFTYALPAHTYAYWGAGTVPATPTSSAPLTDAVAFELATNGKMSAVCYASGTRNSIQDLSSATGNSTQPTDANVHKYEIYLRGDNIFWLIDNQTVASITTGALGPSTNLLPIMLLSGVDATGASSAQQLTSAAVYVGDTSKAFSHISDPTHPQYAAAVKPGSTAAATADPSLVVGLSPNNTGLPVNTPTIVQSTNNKSSGSVASLVKAFVSNNVAGNSIIVVCAVGNGTAPTISDTTSNTYTRAVQIANGTAFNVAIFYAVGIATGANTITISNGGTTASIAMEIYEVSGLIAQIQAQPDQTASATGSSGTAATSVISALTPNEYAFAGIGVGTAAQTVTAGTGWTNDSGQQNPTTPAGLFSFVSLSQYLGSIKSVTPQATFTSEPWAIAVATFRPVILGVEATVRNVSVSNAVLTTVAGSASSVTLFASNPAAQGRIVVNDSTSSLYLAYAATASTSAYTVLLPSNAYWEAPQPVYTGVISGIWASATGNARLSEAS